MADPWPDGAAPIHGPWCGCSDPPNALRLEAAGVVHPAATSADADVRSMWQRSQERQDFEAAMGALELLGFGRSARHVLGGMASTREASRYLLRLQSAARRKFKRYALAIHPDRGGAAWHGRVFVSLVRAHRWLQSARVCDGAGR